MSGGEAFSKLEACPVRALDVVIAIYAQLVGVPALYDGVRFTAAFRVAVAHLGSQPGVLKAIVCAND